MSECCASNCGKAGTSSVSPPQEKGRKYKRKSPDPSQENTVSLAELPKYELHSLKSQNQLQLKVEETEFVGCDDPFACHLKELLSSNLLILFRNAVDQIVDCGYTENVVLRAISCRRLYLGGNDLVSFIVNDTLRFLKTGKRVAGSGDYVFEDLQQIVAYTLVEKINLVREVRPLLSKVEAMWRLLLCDLNVFQTFEMEEDGLEGSSGSNPNKSSESPGGECNPPESSDSDNQKPSMFNSQSNQSEPVRFGTLPNLSNSNNPHASEATTAFCEGTKSISLTFSLKSHTKKEMATLQRKPCAVKSRTYSKGSDFRTANLVFHVDKRCKSPADLESLQARNSSSMITEDMKIPLAESSSTLSTSNNTNSYSLVLDDEEYDTALPDIIVPASVASEKESGFESEEKASVSTKPSPDYYANIPYDASRGIYVPQNKRDELILKLVPRIKDLENELQVWTDWANQIVKQATIRLLKDQPELKELRKEKGELRKETQLLEEATMKKMSKLESVLNNTTNMIGKTNKRVYRLVVDQTLLKKEMEAANVSADEYAERCREAKERLQNSLKDTQSWEKQKVWLQEELKSQEDKVVELQQEVVKAKNYQTQMEATWKQEKEAKDKLEAQADALKKERLKLEDLGKSEEDRIKTKAENDAKHYIENIKRLESKISKLKLKSDTSKIAALKQGFDLSNDGNKSGTTDTKTNPIAAAATTVWENNNGTEAKIERERECVMCLSEEMSVVFLPCAHQVLCSKCNQLHEKEAMEDCPSCRAKIERRIQARFATG